MHSLVFVIVPASTQDIQSEVERLLAGSEADPQKHYQQFETPCSCIGRDALLRSYRVFDATPESTDLCARVDQARADGDHTTAEALLLQRFLAVQASEKAQPDYRQLDTECTICQGTGLNLIDCDPSWHWDYWTIGGRWSGVFNTLPSSAHHDAELYSNIARVGDMPDDFVPRAIVIPEGEWFEGPIVLFGELFEAHLDEEELTARRDWDRQAREFLSRYPDHIAVAVDCHS